MQLERLYPLRSNDIGSDGRLKPSALLSLFEDAADLHATRLGVGFAFLNERGATWVAAQYHLRMARHPGRGEALTLRTWPTEQRRLYAFRHFEVVDGEGRMVSVAASSWLLLDIRTRRPLRPRNLLPAYSCIERRALETDFPEPPPPETTDVERLYRPRRDDIDVNRHVNNAVYVAWAMDTLDSDFVSRHAPVEIEIAFKGEALYGSNVRSATQVVKDGDRLLTHHQLTDAESGRELFRQRVRWRECCGKPAGAGQGATS